MAPADRLADAKTITERDQERGIDTDDDISLDIQETQIKKLGEFDTRAAEVELGQAGKK